MKKSIVKRISKEMDCAIEDFAKKNDMGYTEASRDMAKLSKRMKGSKVLKELEF